MDVPTPAASLFTLTKLLKANPTCRIDVTGMTDAMNSKMSVTILLRKAPKCKNLLRTCQKLSLRDFFCFACAWPVLILLPLLFFVVACSLSLLVLCRCLLFVVACSLSLLVLRLCRCLFYVVILNAVKDPCICRC
jgi:hypothetical protein